MNSCPENSDNFRFIVYSAQVLIPSQFPFDSNSKRRKTDQREASQTTQVQPKGLAHWIDQFTDWQFAVVNHEPEKTQQHFRWCDDISFEHQDILVYTNDNPKHMRRISNPTFAMKAKSSLRSRQEFLHHQARFRRSISNSCVSTYQTLQDGETSSSNSQETLIP